MTHTPDEIRAMLAAATKGPWEANEWYNTDDGGWAAIGPHHQVTHEEAMDGLDDEPDGVSHERAKADAQLIAAAPTIIAELLAEVERLRGLVEKAYEEGYKHGFPDGWKGRGCVPDFATSSARAALEATQC